MLGVRLLKVFVMVCAVAILIIVTWTIVAPTQTLAPAGRWLNVGMLPQRADYVMVLPGGEETRPFIAAAMVRRGLGGAVLIPRTTDDLAVQDNVTPPNHEILRRVLNARGVPDQRIVFLDGKSGSTWQDAKALSAFLADRPDASVAVVTNDYHTRRTRWVFRRALGDKAGRVFFVTAPCDYFGAEDWWQTRLGMKLYLAEYCKFAIYRVRYGDPYVWGAMVVIFLVVVAWRVVGGGRPVCS